MRQWFARLLPVSRRGRDANSEIAVGGALREGASQNAATRRPRPHHRLRGEHAAAGLRQRDPDQSDLEQGVCADAK